MTSDPSSNKNSELLYRLDEKVSEVLRRMGDQDRKSEAAHQEFDSRIAALENFRWWFLGVAAAVGTVSGFLFNVIKEYVTR